MYGPGDQHPNRSRLGVFDLIFLVKGTLFIGEEQTQWDLRPGQALLLLPDRHHYPVKPCEEPTEFYWIHFQSAREWEASGNSLSANRISLAQYWTVTDIGHAERFFRYLLTLSLKPRSISLWEEQSTFWDLLRYMEEGRKAAWPSSPQVIADKTETYLKQHYQAEITNESLAEALHFHPNYVIRCMKDVYNCTPMEYLFRYRIEQAKLLLLKTEWPVSVIAEQAGFRYAPYFSSCFKKQTGESPLKFRQRFKGSP
ncbi:AraC family transcriptional regulator [Cohnella sp. CFH 77786]|uniref:AraC family transcriptional regulator n=1 Tax=Cohnella sp. CFH 77786 TaxID=2662265 RepID=UPI00351CF020